MIHMNKILSRCITGSKFEIALSDCYQDGVINSCDCKALLEYIVDYRTELPVIPNA